MEITDKQKRILRETGAKVVTHKQLIWFVHNNPDIEYFTQDSDFNIVHTTLSHIDLNHSADGIFYAVPVFEYDKLPERLQ